MEFHKPLSTLLLLTLVAPAAPAAAAGVRPGSVSTATASAIHEAFSPATIDRVGAYLRQDNGRQSASVEEQRAWDAFYPECDQVIRRFAAKLNLRGDARDDCVQEVWAELLKRLPSFEMNPSRGRFTSWLYTIVRSKACDIARRESRHPVVRLAPEIAEQVVADESAHPGWVIERQGDRERVLDALALLKARSSAKSYQVLYLRQLEGLPVQQVASALGLTPQQVWVREHRTKRKLRALLDVA